MCILNLGDLRMAVRVKCRSRHNQNRRVDQQCDHQRKGRVEGGVANRFAPPGDGFVEVARLHQRRVQIQIVRHYRGAEDADGDKQHRRIGNNLRRGHEARCDLRPIGMRQRDHVDKAAADHQHQRHDQRFHIAKAARLQHQNQQHIGDRNHHPRRERNAEQQVERDGGADDFRQIGRANRELRQQPQAERHRRRIVIAARLRQIAPCGNAQPRR